MDNLSHSLVGLAVGELVHRSMAPEPAAASQKVRRRMLLVACWAASNFPDLDLLFTPLLPRPLGYLLLHRGHTHTLLLALPQALLLAALIWLLWPAARRLLAASAPARRALALSITLGLLLHLSMDFLNSYGIHPFYPVDNRWLYGDMVFILEPVFWIGAGVPLALMVTRTCLGLPLSRLLLLLLAGVPLAAAQAGFLHGSSLILLGLVGLVAGVAQARAGSHGRAGLLTGLAACLAFVAVQAGGSARGARMLADDLRGRDPASELVDAAMSAYPANMLCWNFVAVERNEAAGAYRLRSGVLSLAPALLAASHCRAGSARAAPAIAIALVSEHAGNLAQLRQLARENCHFRAWLRFARAPQLAGELASDSRFSAIPGANFSTIDLATFAGKACPLMVPPWDYPRADLLRAAAAAPR